MKKLFLILFLLPTSLFAGEWIHPDVRAAMERPESEDFVIIDGVKYPTGYHPSLDQYNDATFRRARVRTATIPKDFSLRAMSHSPVRRQANNDCWAQAAVSALEMTVNFADRSKQLFSIQDVIDCSGFGTARSGGQMSMKRFEKAIVLDSVYPYTGRDQRCKSVDKWGTVKRSFYYRGASGGLPTLQELQSGVLDYGAFEVCGSASALGSGGRQDTIRNGVVNHCYALTGWVDGKSRGWLDAVYLELKNSWGPWGDQGYGYYPLAKGDGVHLKGSVITEIQGVEYKPLVPPGPTELVVESNDVTLKVVIQPDAEYSVEEAKVALQSAINSL